MDLYPQPLQESASPLAQILALIQKKQQTQDNSQQQQVQMQPTHAPKQSGADLGAMIKTGANVQYLPWLSPGQNLASIGGALAGSSGTGVGSALSSLASMFV